MARFDLHRNANPRTRGDFPYLLDVQSDLLDPLATRIVIPLVRRSELKPMAILNPEVEHEGAALVLSTAEIAGVPRQALGPRVANLSAHRDAIVRAIDFLISGV